jgi:peptide/nickel transport system permease protein
MTADLTAAPEAVPARDLYGRRFGAARTALRYGRVRAGLVLTGSIVLLALVGPAFAPHAPAELVFRPFAAPSGSYPLGTDYLGHDVLSRVLWGGRSLLWMSLAATSLGMLLGVAIGLYAAYARGVLDEVLMRGMDVVLAFPLIILVLLFVSMLGSNLWLIVLLVALGWTPQVARITRGATLELVRNEFVEAAESLGTPRRRILTKEILPNIATPLLVEFGLRFAWSIAIIAAISFLGYGVQQPDADWGLMVNENRLGLGQQPWAVVVPAVLIAALTVGANLIADGLSRSIGGIDRAGLEDR